MESMATTHTAHTHQNIGESRTVAMQIITILVDAMETCSFSEHKN